MWKKSPRNTNPPELAETVGWSLYSFLGAPATNYHKIGGSKQQKCMLSPESQKSKIKVTAGPRCLRKLEGKFCSCIFQLLVAPDVPWPVAASLQSLPLSAHSLLFCVSLLCVSLIRTLVIGFRVHPDKDPTDLFISRSSAMSAKTLFPNKVIFRSPHNCKVDISLGATIQPTTG